MVQKDIFSDEQLNETQAKLVRPTRRMFAAIFDIVFLFSTGYLLLSPIIKKASTNLLLSVSEREADLYILLMIATLSVLTYTYQTIGIFFFNKTAGMAVMGLKVAPMHGKKITLPQALLRSALFQLETLFFAVPFLEVWTHPKGYTLHDRGSDTQVVETLAEKQTYIPNYLEVHFFKQMGAGFFASIIFILGLKFVSGYVKVLSDEYLTEVDSRQLSCLPTEVLDRQTNPGDLDLALSLYFSNEINSDCLTEELERKFWSNQNWNAQAYLVKAFLQLDQGLDSADYFAKACDESSSKLICNWGKFARGESVESISELPSLVVSSDLLSAKVYFANSALNLHQGSIARYILESLDDEPVVSKFLVSGKVKLNRIENQRENSDSQIEVLESLLGSYALAPHLAWTCRFDMAQDCRESQQNHCKKVEVLADKYIELKSNMDVSVALLKHRFCVDKNRIVREDMGAWFSDAGWNELVDYYSNRPIVKDDSYLNRLKKQLVSNQIAANLKIEILNVVVKLSKTLEDYEFVATYLQERQLSGSLTSNIAKQVLKKSQAMGAEHVTAMLNRLVLQPEVVEKQSVQMRAPANQRDEK